MAKTNSPQEAILKQLTMRSLAAPFVFAPDNTRVGDDEPADLVWACNNCIILMYMTERKDYPSKEKRDRVRQKAIEHNLGQANRWLKAWRGGKPLQGSNGYSTFYINHDPNYHVIVLSIIQCGDPVAFIHDEAAKKFGVTCCATLPQSAVQALAGVGGTSLDLLALVDEVRKHAKGNALPEDMVSAIICSYARACWDHFSLGDLWPNYQTDDRFHEASYAILTARRRRAAEGSGEATPNWIGMSDLSDVFNDIFLFEFFYVTKLVALAFQQVKDNPQVESIFGEAKMNIYDFGLCVGSGMSQAALDCVSKTWGQELQSGRMRFGPIIVIDCKSRNLEIFVGKRSGLSQTEQLLTQWAVR